MTHKRTMLTAVDELRDALRRGARDDEEPFVYLSAVALALGAQSGTPELLELFDELDDVDAEALDGLAFGATPLDGEIVERLSQHASPYVRGALLRRLLDDGDGDVRAAARHALQPLAEG
jgi:hypothetical protein